MVPVVLLAGLAAADTLAVSSGLVGRWGDRACVNDATCHALAVAPSVPVTVAKLNLTESGSQYFGHDLSVGVGATLMLARGTFRVEGRPDGERRHVVDGADSLFTLGAAVQAGSTESSTGEVLPTLTVSGLVGSRWLALSYGYDLRNKNTFVGLAVNLTGPSILPGAAHVVSAWR